MNPTSSDTVSVDVFLEFEEDVNICELADSVSAPAGASPATAIGRLKRELAALTVEQRAELASFLIRSLDGVETNVAAEQEATRRLEEMKAGKVVGIPAARVFAELREKHS